MHSKPWKTDDPEFPYSPPKRPPAIGRPTLCVTFVTLLAYVILSHRLGECTSLAASPPGRLQVLVPKLPGSIPQGAEPMRDRFIKVAPGQLDERAIVVARTGIDDRMIVDPYPKAAPKSADVGIETQSGTPTIGRLLIPEQGSLTKSLKIYPIAPKPR